MQIHVRAGDIREIDTEMIVVNLFAGVTQPEGATKAVDLALGGRITDLIEAGDIKGKLGEVTVLYLQGELKARRVAVAGLGQQDDFDLEAVRHTAGAVAQRARDLGVRRYATVVHGGGVGGMHPSVAAQALTEGSILALYQFRRHKTEPDPITSLDEMQVVEYDTARVDDIRAGVRVGTIVAECVNITRDLVNEPANYATPVLLAQFAQTMAQEVGLGCKVLERDDILSMGMGAFLAVSEGSAEPPKLVVLEHGDSSQSTSIVFVGKGITFDSGGLSLKPGENMHLMKGDMAGGAAVMGVMRAAALLGLPRHIVGLIPLTENLPGGRAFKPGDVLTSMSGKTIEVQNTDAEGRLILADVLAYAVKFEPQAIVDVATLTGACVVALGNITTGLFCNNDELAAGLEKAGRTSGERCWRMPLFKEYGEQLKSEVADVRNVGGRPAGAITAAFFLSGFVGGRPWAHLDIAGTARHEKGTTPHGPTGASGVGVRLLTEFVRNWDSG